MQKVGGFLTKRAIKFLFIILSLVGLILLFFATSVRTKAMNSEIDLNRTIMIVKRELETAENILIKKDKVLFEIYKNNPFSESGHMAELELRRRYPEEYSRYIEAKSYLDDLYYSRFLIIANNFKGDK